MSDSNRRQHDSREKAGMSPIPQKRRKDEASSLFGPPGKKPGEKSGGKKPNGNK